MAKRSPKVRAAQKRAQRKHKSSVKAKARRVNPSIIPKPIRAVTAPVRSSIERRHSTGYAGYDVPAPEPIPQSAVDALTGLTVADKRALFEAWANDHSKKASSAYYPEMTDKQVSDAYKVYVWNKDVGYGTEINVGQEIWDYIHEYDLDLDLDESDYERYV